MEEEKEKEMENRIKANAIAFYKKEGLERAFSKLLKTKKFDDVIDKSFKELIAYYKKVRENAPKMVSDSITRQLSAYEQRGKEIFGYDAIWSFKLSIYDLIKSGTSEEKEAAKALLAELKAGKYTNVLDDIQQVSHQMVLLIPIKFFENERKNLKYAIDMYRNFGLSTLAENLEKEIKFLNQILKEAEENADGAEKIEIFRERTPKRTGYNPK